MTAKLETYQELCYPNQCLYFTPTSVVSIKYFPLFHFIFNKINKILQYICMNNSTTVSLHA